MKQTVSKHDFREAFKTMGRNDSFSYEGFGALYDYLTDMEDDTGEDMELDVIGICCDFSEHDNARACVKDLGYDDFDGDNEEDAINYLNENTTVIVFNSGIIIAGF